LTFPNFAIFLAFLSSMSSYFPYSLYVSFTFSVLHKALLAILRKVIDDKQKPQPSQQNPSIRHMLSQFSGANWKGSVVWR
jgi:hypothetical protein